MEELNNNENIEKTNIADENTDISAAEEAFEQPYEEEAEASSKSNLKKEILDWVVSIVVALAVALFIRQFIFTLVRVDGPSMLPTLHHNDTLYVNRFMYTPEVGDVIIFRPPNSPSTPYVKRVIAVEGQEVVVDAREQSVYVDGVKLEEDYISEALVSAGTMEYPFTVPEDHVFVLGDNRNNSRDSRDASVGAVPRKNIIGKVIFRLLPVSDFGTIYD